MDGELILDADAPGLERPLAGLTLLEAAAVRAYARLLVVPGGTHYVAVEYPELVNLRIEKFFRERGHVAE